MRMKIDSDDLLHKKTRNFDLTCHGFKWSHELQLACEETNQPVSRPLYGGK